MILCMVCRLSLGAAVHLSEHEGTCFRRRGWRRLRSRPLLTGLSAPQLRVRLPGPAPACIWIPTLPARHRAWACDGAYVRWETLHGHNVQAAHRTSHVLTPAGTVYRGMHSYDTALLHAQLIYQQKMSLQVIATKNGPASWPLETPPPHGRGGRGKGKGVPAVKR